MDTVRGVYLWNLLLARMAGSADLPLWVSANMPDGDAALREPYAVRVPMLG